MLKKKIWANFQRIIELFAQKIVTKLSKVWVWDPGSGKTYSGSRGQKATNPGSRIPNLFLELIEAKIIYKQFCEICGYKNRYYN